jgi:pilus assembly protein FimV
MGSNDPTDREDVALSTSELDDVLSSAEIRSESGNDEESGLEKYGIWIKVEPETLEAEAGGGFEIGELEGGSAPGAQLTAEEEELLGELETEVESPAPAPRADIHVGLRPAVEAADFEGLEKDLQELDASGAEGPEELDLDMDELSLEPDKGSEVEVPLSESIPELDSLEEAAETEVRAAGARSSDAILKKIEEDLKQIKREIQILKKELAGRGGQAEASHTATAPGFFPEEEDDSIALTGDELDNILNTADITEEQAGAPGAVEDLQEVAPADEVENLDLMEPGSLNAEPEEVEIQLEEKPSESDLELGALEEELPASPELELEELEGDGASELTLEEPAESPAPQAEALSLEEAAPAEELSLEDLSGESAAEPLELETLAEDAEPAPAEPLELVEELPDLSLSDEEAAPESAAEPVELELMDEAAEPAMAAEPAAEAPSPVPAGQAEELPEDLREDVKSVLSYLDQLLEALPDEKIRQFAQSEYFGVYKRLFEELGLGA